MNSCPAPANQHAHAVLPTGDLFTFSERMSRILVGETGEYRVDPDTGEQVGLQLVFVLLPLKALFTC
jgi:hypothetical protein